MVGLVKTKSSSLTVRADEKTGKMMAVWEEDMDGRIEHNDDIGPRRKIVRERCAYHIDKMEGSMVEYKDQNGNKSDGTA